jgi:hypothetical protein
MPKKTINIVATLGVVIMVARDLWHEYQSRHSISAVLFFACFYGIFWGYCFYCYRKYNDQHAGNE